ncbi:MAG: ATP synthase F0 subunit A [Chloroflexi bacterium GWC2_73_18]|nr:MAG: ATP synthase F0 subunit A [Chloroflexi bacterium GWC2_73_18]
MAIEERMEVLAAGAEMAPAEAAAPSRRRSWLPILIAVLAIVALDVAASILVPPVSAGGGYPKDGIAANIEKVPPHVVLDLQHGDEPAPGALVYFEPTISSTIVTSWIVMTTLLVLAVLATRRLRMIPRGVQNAVEFLYETLANFATSIGGDRGRRYVPLFAGLFIFILFSNWSGLMPFVGKVELLRAPTSDLNITVGLALVSFVVFHVEGVRSLGMRGYLGKFFPLGEFRKGIGAGLIGLFVGVLEFFLEFIKPVTLSMRLFGNIYGGEIALGVVTALLVAILPVALVGLEFLLNFVQALIFSTLTLVFTLIAIEGHGGEEHEAPRPREGEHAIGEAAAA